jgi:hypothetical protein
MKSETVQTKTRSQGSWLVRGTAAILMVLLLVAASDAEGTGGGSGGLPGILRKAALPVLVGAAVVTAIVLVPSDPSPRSPFQPPTTVSVTPPYGQGTSSQDAQSLGLLAKPRSK